MSESMGGIISECPGDFIGISKPTEEHHAPLGIPPG
jgi:hypothetical protein